MQPTLKIVILLIVWAAFPMEFAFGQQTEEFTVINLSGHNGPVEAVAISGSGRLGLSAECECGTLNLWDLVSGKLMQRMKIPPNSEISLIGFSSDEKSAVICAGHSMLVWDLMSPDHTRKLPILGDKGFRFGGLALKTKSIYAVTTPKDIVVWDLARERETIRYFGDTAGVSSIVVSSDAKYLYGVTESDLKVRKWNLNNKLTPQTLSALDSFAIGLVLLRDNVAFVTACRDSLNWHSENKPNVIHSEKSKYPLTSMDYAQTADILVVGSSRGGVKFWNGNKKLVIKSLLPERFVSSVAIANDGKVAMVGFGNPYGGPGHIDNKGSLAFIRISNVKKN